MAEWPQCIATIPPENGGKTSLDPETKCLRGAVDTKQEEEEYSASLEKYRNTIYNESDLLPRSVSPIRLACLSKALVQRFPSPCRSEDIRVECESFSPDNTYDNPKEFNETIEPSWWRPARTNSLSSSSEGSLFAGFERDDSDPVVEDEEEGMRAIEISSPPMAHIIEKQRDRVSIACGKVLGCGDDVLIESAKQKKLFLSNSNTGDKDYSRQKVTTEPVQTVKAALPTRLKHDKLCQDNDDDSLFGDYTLPGRSFETENSLTDSSCLSDTDGKLWRFIRVAPAGLGCACNEIFLHFGWIAHDKASLKCGTPAPIYAEDSPDHTIRTGSDTEMKSDESKICTSPIVTESRLQITGTSVLRYQNSSLLRLMHTKVFGIIHLAFLVILLIIVMIVSLVTALVLAMQQQSPPNNTNVPDDVPPISPTPAVFVPKEPHLATNGP